MAILSGLLGNVLVEGAGLGPTAPFDAAIVVMLAGGAVVVATWSENHGGGVDSGLESIGQQFKEAIVAVVAGEEDSSKGMESGNSLPTTLIGVNYAALCWSPTCVIPLSFRSENRSPRGHASTF